MDQRIALIAVVLAGSTALSAQRVAKEVPVAGTVVLRAQPDLIRGSVQALPRVLRGDGVSPEIAAKINAALAKEDARVKQEALGCEKDLRESFAATDRGVPDGFAWERSVSVTMRGPRFVAYVATDGFYCGGPHPNGVVTPMVYDLRTGDPVDWLELLPKEVTAFNIGAERTGWVEWDFVRGLAKAQANADCKDVFDETEGVPFTLNLNARSGTLDVTPADFPHVWAACEKAVALDPPTLRRLHVAESLVSALEQAHAMQKDRGRASK